MEMIAGSSPLSGSTEYLATWRHIRWLRFALPLTMLIIAASFELWEHGQEGRPWLDPIWAMELVLFAILGPLAFFLLLTYMDRVLFKLHKAHTDIASLNWDLEQKVIERTAALEQANLRLQEIDQMKSDFVSLVSHELRAPLSTLNGGLEVALQHEEMLPPRAQRILHLLLGETERLTDFVQTILDTSQLEAGKLHLNCGAVAIKPMLKQAVAITIGPDTERVVWQLPADIPPIWVDETYTEEALRNLLRNAHKYTPPQSPIELKVTVEDRRLCVCVTDHGPGISIDQQQLVFARFTRALNNRHGGDQPHGWGLGLHFARMLLEAQGGAIELQSPVHADPTAPGCRFKLTLPLAEEEVVFDGTPAPH
jgi:signal transduction histidine kinase